MNNLESRFTIGRNIRKNKNKMKLKQEYVDEFEFNLRFGISNSLQSKVEIKGTLTVGMLKKIVNQLDLPDDTVITYFNSKDTINEKPDFLLHFKDRVEGYPTSVQSLILV